MKDKNIKVEYIYNSCFTIETEHNSLVIDYFKGDLTIPKDKNVVFLVSHHHYDHFNREIFNYEDASYIISFDVDDIQKRDNIKIVNIGDKIEFNNIYIYVIGSTDEGSSFYIEVDGIKIFHAGDLNWWAWNDQGEEKEIEREENFKKEIDKLIGYEVDLSFFPVDPRLKDRYYLGPEYFIKEIKPKYLFPMHFKDDYSHLENFIDLLDKYSTSIFKISKTNEVFHIEL